MDKELTPIGTLHLDCADVSCCAVPAQQKCIGSRATIVGDPVNVYFVSVLPWCWSADSNLRMLNALQAAAPVAND